MELNVIGTEELVEQHKAMEDYLIKDEEAKKASEKERFNASLAGHITSTFLYSKDARRDSGIEKEILDSLAAFNGEYTPSQRSAIEEDGGSKVFMNVTATKCRACASWIKDILLPAQSKSWSFSPSKEPEINPMLMDEITQVLEAQFKSYQMEQQRETEAPQGAPPPTPEAGQQGASTPMQQQQQQPMQQPQETQEAQEEDRAGKMATKLREMNRAKRDIEETFRREVEAISRGEMKKLEDAVEDQLTAGDWDKALGEVIDDFTVFPAAFLKGPIIQKSKGLTYVKGQPVATEETVFYNRRVSPLDMYPSANATDINDGSLIEHVRFEKSEIASLRGLPHYDDVAINKILTTYQNEGFNHWIWSDIESDKADAEKRGNEFQANRNVIHGLHFFGKAPVKLINKWGVPPEVTQGCQDTDEIEIEAILIDQEVIKVRLNKDPLLRRPYYKASFQTRPGSFWGRSLPHLMKDIQKFCNATARALANNMGMASGPQMEIVVDRLADKGDIEDQRPFKIWQTTMDPTGAGGRAVQWHQPSSNAGELLAVYDKFELKADDATGIPRYAYGNERTGGAASTAAGLSMLLESATKGIRNALRQIDLGVIIPRLEYQFYWLMKENKDLNYSGDLNVVPIGSAALTIKAAEQAKRVELMQALSGNPQMLEVVGQEAMAKIFKILFEDAHMPEIIIPSGLEIRQKSKEKAKSDAAQYQQSLELEKEKVSNGLKATELQVNGQKEMHSESLQLKQQELQVKAQDTLSKDRSKVQELQSREKIAATKALSSAEESKTQRDFNDLQQRRDLAFRLTDSQENKSEENQY